MYILYTQSNNTDDKISERPKLDTLPDEVLKIVFESQQLSLDDKLNLHGTCTSLRNTHNNLYKTLSVKPKLDFKKESALQSFIDFSKYYTIKVLNLSKTNITDEILKAILEKCPNLTNLNLSYCKDITDAGLAVAQHCTNLTSLNLSGQK